MLNDPGPIILMAANAASADDSSSPVADRDSTHNRYPTEALAKLGKTGHPSSDIH